MKILNSNAKVESNKHKSDNNLQKSNKKSSLVDVGKENINKLPEGIKILQKQKRLLRKEQCFYHWWFNDKKV